LNSDLMIIGRQIHTDFGGYIDILALDADGDLAIIELKRDKTPRDVVAQCLDYASWISELNYNRITDLYKKYNGKNLSDQYQEFFNEQLPESLNENHQIVIVAASLDDSTERIIQYLSDKHSMNINAVFFNIFELNGTQILGRSWFKDPEIIEEKASIGKRAPWTGYWFVNTGIREDRPRDWELNIKYSYMSAGNGPRWINAIKKLSPGDKLFAYIAGTGYVGYGIVEEEAVHVSEYQVDGEKMIDDLPDEHPWKEQKYAQNDGEWLAKINWMKTFPREEAKRIPNIFANQNVVCKLRDRRTFDFLVKEFDIDQENS
ncbi:MAG: hypothetical protein KKE61_17365, partial [Proteobacteria bacterium]|nr:hypothetical protein [Pseudomonadota bacterium]